jgi:hypothetical protein
MVDYSLNFIKLWLFHLTYSFETWTLTKKKSEAKDGEQQK